MDRDELRAMRLDEAEAVSQLLLRANEEHLAAFPAEVARTYRAELADVSSRQRTTETYVAVRDGRPVATVAFVPDAADDAHPWPPGGAVLRFLAVEPAVRGQGYGKRLTALCITRAREQGARYVALHTAPQMVGARRVYEALGFVRTPEHDFDPAAHYAGRADETQPAWGLAYLLRLTGQQARTRTSRVATPAPTGLGSATPTPSTARSHS